MSGAREVVIVGITLWSLACVSYYAGYCAGRGSAPHRGKRGVWKEAG